MIRKIRKILVTPRSLKTPDHPALAPLREAGYEILIPCPGVTPDPETLKKALPECDGWLAGVEKITADIIAAGTRLKIISRNGVGVDNVDPEAARARNIKIANTPGTNARGVAELALGLILAAARFIPACDASIKKGGWDRTQGVELEGRTLGVVGFGMIGRLLAKMAAGLGMKTVGYDLYPNPEFAFPDFSYVEPDELIRRADVISMHIPGGDKPFINADSLAMARNGLILVNTARATAVDNDAVLAALDSGKVFAYGVDAFDPEPPGVTALTSHPRVICTSHIGGFTKESVLRSATMASRNIVAELG